ncbi:MAG: hypothetical protein QOI04_932 [Verrucomicrobiota bacterium]
MPSQLQETLSVSNGADSGAKSSKPGGHDTNNNAAQYKPMCRNMAHSKDRIRKDRDMDSRSHMRPGTQIRFLLKHPLAKNLPTQMRSQ